MSVNAANKYGLNILSAENAKLIERSLQQDANNFKILVAEAVKALDALKEEIVNEAENVNGTLPVVPAL